MLVCVLFRVHLQNYLEQILSRMQGLMVLSSPNNGVKQCLSPEDQQFMYETAGVLIVQSQFTPEVSKGILSNYCKTSNISRVSNTSWGSKSVVLLEAGSLI